MRLNPTTAEWLLDSDPSLKWQVERDLLYLPEHVWGATKASVGTTGFGARLLELQDVDGQWAGGAYFPTRRDDRAVYHDDDDDGQPYTATTWSLNQLREWGVDAALLGDTGERLAVNCKWEYDDLPYWGGEVDVCINAWTLANGGWLGQDVTQIATWLIEHQMDDGGWNCDWENGATVGSLHSTIDALIGILDYERRVGRNADLSAARARAEEYLLQRRLMFKLSTGEKVAPWVTEFIAPARWRYSTLRALDYFKAARDLDGGAIDERLADAIASVRDSANANGRWINDWVEKGSVWFEVDAPIGEESKWNTFLALRVLGWWDTRTTA